MACTRESLLTIPTPSLKDVDVSFREVMEQIVECKSHVNVHIALTCIRLFLCIPVVLLKPVWKKVSGQPKQHTVMEWHAVSSDQIKANSDKLFVLWNGDKFVIPVSPTPVAELSTNLSNTEENFDAVKDLIKETIDMLPKSKIKKAFREVQKMDESSSDLLNSCKSSTGWADLSLPKLSSVESAGSIAASRIPTRRQPEKVQSFTISVPPQEGQVEEEPAEGSQSQSQSVTFTEESTGMEENQCPRGGGGLFANRDDLNSHITSQHKPNNWNCSKCDKIYDSRGVLSKHFRDKHQGLFQYKCQECDYGNDDRMCFAHHVLKKHGVEIEGIVKCPNENWNYVAPQKCILLTHLDTCGEAKQNKKYKCDECEKGYRSRKYLNLHKLADHPEEGADIKQFLCDYQSCEKIYKSLDALRNHKKPKGHIVA